MNNFKKIIDDFSHKHVLVVGDIMIDKYIYGEIERISPEAPVPVLKKIREECRLGGAANVANTLVELGAKVSLLGVVGDDYAGEVFYRLLQQTKIVDRGIIIDHLRPTTVKERFIAHKNHAFRVDHESTDLITEEFEDKLISSALEILTLVDGIVFSDYAKGVLSERLVRSISDIAKKNNKKIFADIKPKNKKLFVGVDLITPNFKEGKEMSGAVVPEEVGTILVNELQANVLLTLGDKGILVASKEGKTRLFPSLNTTPLDVTGAGDAVIAVAALAFLSNGELESTALLGNYAGGLVIQKPGTATVSQEELLSILNEDHHVESVTIVPKVWGFEKWLENNEQYCSKILSINKGFQCSLHYHKIKDEMFLVTKGNVRLELDGEVLFLRPGNFIRVTPGQKHRFRGLEDSEMVEISTHHDEADSFRIEESKKVELG